MIVNPRELAVESHVIGIPSDRLIDIADEINGQLSTVTAKEFALLQRSRYFSRFKHVFQGVAVPEPIMSTAEEEQEPTA